MAIFAVLFTAKTKLVICQLLCVKGKMLLNSAVISVSLLSETSVVIVWTSGM